MQNKRFCKLWFALVGKFMTGFGVYCGSSSRSNPIDVNHMQPSRFILDVFSLAVMIKQTK